MAAASSLQTTPRLFFHSPKDLLCRIFNEPSRQRRNPRWRTKTWKAARLSIASGEYLVEEYGWGVRRMTESGNEMRNVADVQAEAFYVPLSFFNDVFLEFFRTDCTVQRDEDVLRHLQGAEEYLYVSGIAVRSKFRRQKVGTVLLKACDALSQLWGHDYIALRAYEDDSVAQKLYSKAGFRIVSIDPHWVTWIGKRKRILMIKSFAL